MYVLVTDDNGGHSEGQVSVLTGGPEVFFSGTVLDAAGSALGGASVSINGQATATNSQGYFFIELPKESSRYILNIAKVGYALFSRVMFTDFAAATFSLVKSQTSIVDPQKPIDVTESFPQGKRTGAEVRIEANSLVDRAGRAPAGALYFSISTVDLRDPVGRVPGNGGGIVASGPRVRVSSYGAVDVEIRDASGNLYNLARGKTATLRIPVDPAAERTKTPPRSVPLWFYDQQTALWRQEGSAQLSEHFYEADVNHLSAIDVGVAASNAACMRLHFDPGSVSFPFTLNVT